MTKQSIEEFLDALASADSTPGGGSAAAIMGAMGAALVSMVGNLTVGKEKYAAVESEMQDMLLQSESLRARLTVVVQDDVRVFDAVMDAYGLPKDTDEQKQARSSVIQDALKDAADVPLACARLCADVIALCSIAGKHGNRNVVSDAGVAVLAAHAALRSAALNVYINAGAIKDQAFVQQRVGELEELLATSSTATEKIYELVKSQL